MVDPIVDTRWGRIRGRFRNGVAEFLGVPYAAPPVGELRFRPPRPPASWTGIRAATSFSPAAPQLAVGLGLAARVSRLLRGPMDEDCLYLNVWTPSPDRGHRAVVVWLHGGAFILGAGSTFLYNGAELASRGDIVVVTINYRLGALGFLDLTSFGLDHEAPANLGLRDQIAALDWVHDNIELFGGDPTRVTLAGESAGAMSIGAHLATDASRFHRAVLQSGAAANVATADQAAYVAERFLAALGATADDRQRLMTASVAEILDAQRRVMFAESRRMGRLPWQPSVDGELLRGDPLASIADCSAAGVDLIVGSNRDEWKLFTAHALAMRAMGAIELERRLEHILSRTGHDPAQAAEALQLYRQDHRRGHRATPYELWVAIRTDEMFRLPALALAEAQMAAGNTVFVYRCDFEVPALRRSLGACHAVEVPLLFATQNHPLFRFIYLGSRAAERLSQRLQEAWSAFATGGRPTFSSGERWPRYDTTSRGTMVLGKSCRVLNAPGESTRRFWLGPDSETTGR